MEDLTYLLDTSVFIDYFRQKDKHNACLVRCFPRAGSAMSAVALMELEVGTRTPDQRKFLVDLLSRYPVLPFDESAGRNAGEIQRLLTSRNQAIDIRDLMTGAIAVSRNLILGTLNRSHFSRIEGLRLADVT